MMDITKKMRLNNLIITDCDIKDRNAIIEGISELELVINDNYDIFLERELLLEFNLGTRLGTMKDYIVIYSNPLYKKIDTSDGGMVCR